VLAQFVHDEADAAERIKAAVRGGDASGARRIAHTVKGLAGTLSADQLKMAAATLESLLTKGQPETALLAPIEQFDQAMREVIEEASRRLVR
jgi:HPt (histidine-containing phosphotransfer) domain-containing protein